MEWIWTDGMDGIWEWTDGCVLWSADGRDGGNPWLRSLHHRDEQDRLPESHWQFARFARAVKEEISLAHDPEIGGGRDALSMMTAGMKAECRHRTATGVTAALVTIGGTSLPEIQLPAQ